MLIQYLGVAVIRGAEKQPKETALSPSTELVFVLGKYWRFCGRTRIPWVRSHETLLFNLAKHYARPQTVT